MKINKEKHIVSIWGIQDGSGFPNEGWSEFFPTHDHALCIMKDGEIQSAIELERLTRVKNDNTLSDKIEGLIEDLPEDFIAVVVNDFNGNAFISKNGLWRTECDRFALDEIISPAYSLIKRKKIESYVCPHELAHIGANLVFYGNFKENSLLVHIDGLASQSCASVYLYKNKKIRHIYHGFDLLKEVQLFGFNDLTCQMMGGKNEQSRLSTPGKLMGYSSYGSYDKNLMKKLIKEDWYHDHWKNPKFYKDFNVEEIDLNLPLFKNIAYCCQKAFEDKVLEFLKKYQKLTGAENLYYSGGCALNINLNSLIIKSGLFKNVYIPPCCSDTGLAIGGAAIIEFLRGNKIKKHSAYQNSIGISNGKVNKLSQVLVDDVCKHIYEKKVVGVCIGNAESGPRALGHRTLLALPTQDMFEKVSMGIKKREWFRPLAPIITESRAKDIFEDYKKNEINKFMLLSYKIKKRWQKEIAGVCHIDNTARPQIIEDGDRETIHIQQILECMWEKYHIPCLINTSFNGKGEPIVHTPQDAISSATRIGVDYVLFNDKIIEIKKGQ